MKRRVRWPLSAALVALLLLLLAARIAYVFYGSSSASADVTDPGRYQAILNDLGYPTPTKLNVPTIACFPPAIPAAATNVRFFFRPSFFQGGTQLQLRMNLPAEEIAAVLGRIEPYAKDIQAGGAKWDAANARHGLPSACFRDSSNTGFAVEGLPADFKVFVLGAKDSSPPSWNHGYSYGVAIRDKSNEVIYWLEDW
ncbi:MAG: hypothetical protein ACM359_03625 [Bacillota bacterium]